MNVNPDDRQQIVPADMSVHVLIADDHAAVRRGLREILADALPKAEWHEAESGDEVMDLLAHGQYSALLLDLNMPGRNGLDVLREVKQEYPRLPVIVVSIQPEDLYAARCLQAGATAYINKNNASDELVPAARRALEAN